VIDQNKVTKMGDKRMMVRSMQYYLFDKDKIKKQIEINIEKKFLLFTRIFLPRKVDVFTF